MRTWTIKTGLTALAFAAASAAYADTATMPIAVFGRLDLSLGSPVNFTVQPYPPIVTIPEAPINYPLLTWNSVSYDTASNEILSLTGTHGAQIISAALPTISSGGSLTITDLSVDLVHKEVYANVIGANGVGPLNHFHLWDILTVSGASLNAPGSVEGLRITADGLAQMTQALGLLPLGKAALNGVQGSISWNTIAAVPEPGTWALTLLGLGAVRAAVQRRRKQA